MQNRYSINPATGAIEVSVRDIIAFFKRNFRPLLFTAVCSGLIGIGMSFLMPKEYSARTLLLPEAGMNSKMGKLGSLAGLAGINIGSMEGIEAVRPDLYPDVLKSAPCALYLLSQPVVDQNSHSYKSLRSFLVPNTKSSFFNFLSSSDAALPAKIKGVPEEVISISDDEEELIKEVQKRFSAFIDLKTGIITIESEMPDPVVAALTVQAASNYLTDYVTDYRTQKSRQQAQFLAEQASAAKQRQQRAEYALQSYRDHNRNAYLNVARIEEQRLQAEYTFSQSLYSDLVRQWEQAKIKVKEEQPVFKVLEPAKIPLNKSKPKRLFFGIAFAILGGIAYIMYAIIYKEKLHK